MKTDGIHHKADPADSEPCRKKSRGSSGKGIAVGIALGVAIGVATDNVGLWLALGIVFGAAFDRR